VLAGASTVGGPLHAATAAIVNIAHAVNRIAL
jgi:hypothetical protein